MSDTGLDDDLLKEGEADAEDAAAAEAAETEAKARKAGWVPEAEWDEARAEREGRRKPPKFLTAAEFLERTENDLPVVRERSRHKDQVIAGLERKLGDQDKKLDEMHGILLTQQTMTKEAVARAREKGRADAEADMEAAVDDADRGKYNEAKKKRDAIDAEELAETTRLKPKATEEDEDADAPPAKPRDRREDNPVVADWKARNPWFMQNVTLNNYMIEMYNDLKGDAPGLDEEEALEEAKKMVKAKFPEKFGINPRRNGAATVATPSGERRRSTGGKTFDDLPAEAKQNYERFRKIFEAKGAKYTKDEYLKEYSWE